MNAGKLENDSVAGRLYRYLKDHPGWHGGWELTVAIGTTALSTRISEIRHQLPKNEHIEVQQKGHNWFYRLVCEEVEIPLEF